MNNLAYFIVAIIIGALTGAVGSALHIGVEVATGWPALLRTQSGLEGWALIATGAGLAAGATMLSVFLVRTFAPEASGSGVQEIEGAMEGLRQVRWYRVLPVKFVGGLLALGAGLLSGREGPTIHMGASIAKAAADWQRLKDVDLYGLLAAGGAAGLASAFNAPLASILFVLEETRRQFPYSTRTYGAVALACLVSGIVTTVFTGATPYLLMTIPALSLDQLPLFAVLGVVLGFAGFIFNRTLIAALNVTRAIGLRSSFYIVPLMVGLVVGALMLVWPDGTTGGETLAVKLTQESLPLAMLGVIILVRFILTMGSYSTGVPGGVFAPILALAGALGVAYATALGLAWELPEGMVAALAMAAMGGLFSATIGAPMVGIVLVLELTSAYAVLMPLAVTTFVSYLVSQSLGNRPIYEVLLERTLDLEKQVQQAGTEKPSRA